MLFYSLVYRMITNNQLNKVTSMIDYIIEKYKETSVSKKREWRTYEQRVARRLQTAFKELKPLVQEAVSTIKIIDNIGFL